jgi:hypothetical protein
MTREERRKAIEELLGGAAKTFDVDSGCADDPKKCIGVRCEVITKSDASKKPSGSSCSDTSMTCSEEEPMCSICLGEYEPTDSVFRSKSCPHMFHGECLFSWLERRNNTVSANNPYSSVKIVSNAKQKTHISLHQKISF